MIQPKAQKQKFIKVILLGSTGLVGKHVLKLLSQLEEVSEVYCPVRQVPAFKELNIEQGTSKIHFEEVDFLNLQSFSLKISGDSVICCLGTTKKQAGSKKAQEKIDVRLPLSLAAIAKKQGVKNFLCVSAQGADQNSPFFYNRLKGMLEEGLTMLNFDTLTLVRPALLLGNHKDKRFGETLLQKTIGAHPEWIPAYIRPVYAETVAAHLVASLLKPPTDHICATDGVKGKRIIYNRVLAKTPILQCEMRNL